MLISSPATVWQPLLQADEKESQQDEVDEGNPSRSVYVHYLSIICPSSISGLKKNVMHAKTSRTRFSIAQRVQCFFRYLHEFLVSFQSVPLIFQCCTIFAGQPQCCKGSGVIKAKIGKFCQMLMIVIRSLHNFTD